jgi:NADH oxidase (H2O2-forming)
VTAGLVADKSVVVPDTMLESNGIRVIRDEVIKVDSGVNRVYSREGREFSYDKLFLATGSRAFVPPIEGCELDGVMTLRGLADAAAIKSYLAPITT